MSAFLELNKDFSNFMEYYVKYDDIIAEAESALKLEGKTLEEANKELPALYLHYAQTLQELKSIERFIDARLQAARGESWEKNKRGCDIDLNSRDLEHWVNADKEVMKRKKFLILTQELVGQCDAVVKAIEHMSFKLKDITAARIAEVNQYVL